MGKFDSEYVVIALRPQITLVSDEDQVLSGGSRQEALENGIAHRISRVFIFNDCDELLIQRRSERVSLPLKWDQSVAGHVDFGESYLAAALREAAEELCLTDIALRPLRKIFTEERDELHVKRRFNMLYQAEHSGVISHSEAEVAETRWIEPSTLDIWMSKKPTDFTEGFIKSWTAYKTLTKRDRSTP